MCQRWRIWIPVLIQETQEKFQGMGEVADIIAGRVIGILKRVAEI